MNNVFNFDKDALWQKVGEWARKAGRTASRPVLLLWFVMTDKKSTKPTERSKVEVKTPAKKTFPNFTLLAWRQNRKNFHTVNICVKNLLFFVPKILTLNRI